MMEGQGEHWCEPAVRLRLANLLAQAGDLVGAEPEIRLGLERARARQAQHFELRAALQLYRLGENGGSPALRAEARQAVAGVTSWFQEGLELEELREARRVVG